MIARRGYDLPEEQRQELEHARKLARWTIFWLLTIATLMFVTMGSSQAMKTAWVEDVLSLVPSLLFLLASRRELRAPRERFPYGFHGLSTLAFLGASTALSAVGIFLLYEAVTTLISRHHPTLGAMDLFGHTVWAGWVMIAALAYSIVPVAILGRRKLPLGKKLHQKVLFADADMNKADWMTGVAGILGILGVGLGFWWADSTAAAIISLAIIKDGLTHVKDSLEDLVGRRPITVEEGKPDPLVEELRLAYTKLSWVKEADVRLREEGAVLAGEAYLVPRDTTDVLAKMEEADAVPQSVHWRFYDVVPTIVGSLESVRHDDS